MTVQKRFTMTPRKWYAMEMISSGHDSVFVHYSPIFLFEVRPLKTGKSELEIDFLHLNYSPGVQHKVYMLQVMKRAQAYMLCERTDHNDEKPTFLLRPIDLAWTHKHFPYLKREISSEERLMDWLDRAANVRSDRERIS